ncbi:MAG: carbamoyl-phosphate synthase large subunit, partial [Candidatus Eremiobacterota bacterium]
MPQRSDIKSILVVGSGPITIGQACEFDYSGTQATRALKRLGYRVILINSNPASIMTDPELADATYIEPLSPEVVEAVLRKERPDALLPTLGGQTSLNLAVALHEKGVLQELGVQLLGASIEAIHKAEDRGLFRACLEKVGVEAPRSLVLNRGEDPMAALQAIGVPCILRPAFTLGGGGASLVQRAEDFPEGVRAALRDSPLGQVLIEQSLLGWKEYELEVMRDGADNAVIVCSIENLDPMGVHTGDSITVAPVQTLTDREYQAMRRAAVDIIREVGVATGGCNIQFAVHPQTGRMVCIEANPRVSRSSALASKATGFPIAKIAAQLAVGLTLDEIPNDITGCTPASYEPALDYVVVKIPRFAFDKFPGAVRRLGPSMKSVGEAMAIGRTFLEALQKGYRALEQRHEGLDDSYRADWDALAMEEREEALATPTADRLFFVKYAIQDGISPARVSELSGIDPWYVHQIARLAEYEGGPRDLRQGKRLGYSDRFLGITREQRQNAQFLAVDTCAGEFPATTPYFYSSFEESGDWRPLEGRRVLILSSGPNRIGQGVEFDCMCVQAARALTERGLKPILVNSNPETVSTDYDVSARLYFEPITLESLEEILALEKPEGVILQLGGQTPLKLAHALERLGVKILGTQPEAIDQTESRERFARISQDLGLNIAPGQIARSVDEAREAARSLGYPVLIRPSYVLSGSAMRVLLDEQDLERWFAWAHRAAEGREVLLDKFLEDALEVDVDALADGEDVRLAGVMEHVEEAGIHSGDSACSIPPRNLTREQIAQIEEDLRCLARRLGVVGLMNAQYGVRGSRLYLLEVNPRASRTVPYLSKAYGIDFVALAVDLMLGKKLSELPEWSLELPYTAVKEVVLPWKRLEGMDPLLGPEMKSTGEVMGIDPDPGGAYLKALMSTGYRLRLGGRAFLSVRTEDKRAVVPLARRLTRLGFRLVATDGTARALEASGLEVEHVGKLREGEGILPWIREGEISLVLNTPSGADRKRDAAEIRMAAVAHEVPLVTTLEGAKQVVEAFERHARGPLEVRSLQEWHA